eukprot:4954614-Pleurochrysis_carterae.AAC.2
MLQQRSAYVRLAFKRLEDRSSVCVGIRRVSGYLRGAVGLSQLARHLVRRVFHEDGRVAVRLGHLGLALGEAVEHVVRQDDRLQLDPGRVAVLAREHVHLALVDSKLANVGLDTAAT